MREKKLKNKRVIIFYDSDLDGITSASLVRRAQGNATYKYVSQKQSETFPDVLGNEAYIVDVPLNQKTIGSLQNIHVSKIVWIGYSNSSSTWYWAYRILSERHNVTLSNPLKTKAIAESKVKTDKVDSFTLANLLRGGYIS